MFENLTDRLESVFKKLRGHGKLTEENIQEAMGEVRTALLEADVNFGVVREFVAAVTTKAIGQEVLSSLSPGQQVVKVVHDELVQLLGSEAQPLRLDGRRPAVIMLAGLQGSGKTTTAAKLAKQLKAQGRAPLLVPADVYRPAAIEQLHVLGEQVGVPVFASTVEQRPVEIARQAMARSAARRRGAHGRAAGDRPGRTAHRGAVRGRRHDRPGCGHRGRQVQHRPGDHRRHPHQDGG
jgi:signal recognition particle subunit SRP54